MYQIVQAQGQVEFQLTRDEEWMTFPMDPEVINSLARMTTDDVKRIRNSSNERWTAHDWALQASDGSRGGNDKHYGRLWLSIGERTWHFDFVEVLDIVRMAKPFSDDNSGQVEGAP